MGLVLLMSYLTTGCLESIVHYKLLLLRKYGAELDAKLLSEECRVLLRCLKALDPARRRRYEDLGTSDYDLSCVKSLNFIVG